MSLHPPVIQLLQHLEGRREAPDPRHLQLDVPHPALLPEHLPQAGAVSGQHCLGREGVTPKTKAENFENDYLTRITYQYTDTDNE